jgi:pyruvate/2-oxoglutarate dehydrogenase complex dihydrolipoamide acyltransferase (E2) component
VKKKNIGPREPEDLERTDMYDLVREYLNGTDDKLKLLEEQKLSEAMQEYVDKSQTGAITEAAEEILKARQKILFSNQGSTNNADFDDSLELDSKPAAQESTIDDSSMLVDESPAPKATKKATKPKKQAPAKAARVDSPDDDDDVEIVEQPKAKAKPRAKRTAAKRKVAYADSEDDGDNLSDDDSETPAPKKKKAAPARAASGKTVSKKTPKPSANKRARRRFESDDEDVEEVQSELPSNWGTAATQSQY